ncbi:MAG: hypothetical protein K2N56_02630 [Oscillospiraceae bacterium]|nr:hypothetical protein [Oscillospiraceae bacterium]
MKKFLGYSLLTAACILLSGCAADAHAEDGTNKPRDGYVNEEITVRSGYYTCEEDDSYIHVDGNMIERCNFDSYAWAESLWNKSMEEWDEETREKQAPYHDQAIKNTVELAKESDALQEFVVYTFPWSTYDPEKSDSYTLIPSFDPDSIVRSGYEYNIIDGSIGISDIVYRYAGEELPV